MNIYEELCELFEQRSYWSNKAFSSHLHMSEAELSKVQEMLDLIDETIGLVLQPKRS